MTSLLVIVSPFGVEPDSPGAFSHQELSHGSFRPPAVVSQWMAPLQSFFTRPTFSHVLVLIAGAILALGRLARQGCRTHSGVVRSITQE